MPRTRKFINKKNAITFQLVHRSQHDPLIVDDTVGERVLVPLGTDQRKAEQRKYGINFDDDYDYLQHLKDPCAPPEKYSVHIDKEKIPEEQEDDFDDDDENYEDEDEEEEGEVDDEIEKTMTRFNLPSTVFESKTTNEIGMLNLAAPDSDPKIHWDPDVIAALDEDFDFENDENALDDDFMLKANGTEPLPEEECQELEDEMTNEVLPQTLPPLFIPKNNKPIPLALRRFLDQDDDDDDEVKSNMSIGGDEDHDQQTSKTKYTNYSMTSSVIRRNEGLQNVDQHFDKVFDEYDDEEIGPLDTHPINPQGLTLEDDLLKQTIEQFEEQQMKSDEQIEKIAMEKTKKLAKRLLVEHEETTVITVEDDDHDDEKWDCETILTTYSNLYNHPRLIKQIPTNKIRLSNKTGLPIVDKSKKPVEATPIDESEEEEEEENDETPSTSDRATIISLERKKGETSEERRARKHAVKEMRRDRRMIKKATKLAFKQEEQKQMHDQVLHAAQTRLQSLRVV